MLWEPSGALWRLHDVTRTSSVQLLTHDLAERSRPFSFDESGRRTALDGAKVQPYAP